MSLCYGRVLLSFTATMLGTLLCSPAGAQSGDPQAGLALARQWCTGCHIVEPKGSGGDTAPTFMDIGNEANRTPETLRAWLTLPHPPMPNPSLTRGEIEDIIAYLNSLKR